MKIIQIIMQITIISCFLLLGQWLSHFLPLPIPGSIIGLILLFLALYAHLIKLQWVDLGAKFLTAELLLFFIPAAVGIINYNSLLGMLAIKLVLIIFCSTIVVMACTALIADLLYKKAGVK